MSLVSKLLGSESEGREQIRRAVQNHSLPLRERVDLFQEGLDSTLLDAQGADDRHRMALGAGAGITAGAGGAATLGYGIDSFRSGLNQLRRDRIADQFENIAGVVAENPAWTSRLGNQIEAVNPRGGDFRAIAADAGGISPQLRDLLQPDAPARKAALVDSFDSMLRAPGSVANLLESRTNKSLLPMRGVTGIPFVEEAIDAARQAASSKNTLGVVDSLTPKPATTRALRELAFNPAALGALAVLGGVAGKIKADREQKKLQELAGDDLAVAQFLRAKDEKRLVEPARGSAGILDKFPGAANRAANTLANIIGGIDALAPTEGPISDYVDRDIRQ